MSRTGHAGMGQNAFSSSGMLTPLLGRLKTPAPTDASKNNLKLSSFYNQYRSEFAIKLIE